MSLPFSLVEAEQALLHVSPDCDRDAWFAVCGALKDEFGEAGFDLFDSWSQGGQRYDKAAVKTTWRSASAGHVHIGSLIKMAQEGGWQRAKQGLSAEDKRRLRDEQAKRRAQRQAEIEADEAERAQMQAVVAEACRELWEEHTQVAGSSPYLGAKGVQAHGVRFFKHSLVLVIDDQARSCRIVAGEAVRSFFRDLPKPRPDHISFLRAYRGAIAVPLRAADGVLWSLQVINEKGTKLFPKYSRKKGCFHLLGSLEGADLIGFAEGYATAATVFELAAGWPVVVTFDTGNMQTVAAQLLDTLEAVTPIWLADNDPPNPKTGKRPGLAAAEDCQACFGGAVLLPQFPEPGAA